jgi:hypothetical protein
VTVDQTSQEKNPVNLSSRAVLIPVLVRTCPKCAGTGLHRFDNGLPTYPETGGVSNCMRCNGRGWLSDEDKDT